MKENIKKIANICTLLACNVFLLSCNGFLDKSPLDKVSTDGDLSVKDVVAMVDAAYQPLQWPKLYNMRMWTTDIIAGNSLVGANGGTDGIETTDLANFTATSANAAAIDIWRGPNPGILRCNLALQTIQSVDMPDEIRNRCLGEAYFLRAHYYFILVRVFGDVPLVLTPPIPGTNFSLERTPKAAVYAQIKSDCQEAIN
ncbi:MAG: RagB/SusD family nutrient uptake outer membrane protein, partial [Bacteroidaceae bacterium]|nr:RagB/SusD family nutrient uptake outer membrane protein [Bacteroidaceae bacterium]